jgi:lipopolysaccharide export system permease protein
MQFLWKYVDDFVGKGFDFYIIAELMFYASATFVPMALPLAVLLSSLMTFGNLGENYELVAIKSAGISLQKIMRPLIVFIFFVSIGAFYFSNYVLPKANLEFLSLLSDVRKKKPAVSISEGVFNSDIGNYIIKIGHKDPDGVSISDIIIYDHSKKDGNKNVTRARTGRMEMSEDKHFLILTLNDGVNYNESIQNKNKGNYFPIQITHFSKEIQRIDLSEFNFKKSDKSLRKNNYQMLNVHQLQYFEDSLYQQNDSSMREFVKYSMKDIAFYNKFIGGYDSDSIDLINNASDQHKARSIVSEKTREQMPEEKTIAEIEAKTIKPIVGKGRVLKRDSLLQHNVKDIASSSKSVDSNKIDSVFLFSPDILSHFDSLEQVRIVVGALSFARNASYQASNFKKRSENKMLYIAKYKVEWHRKFTLSVACLILFFIGAPLGAIIRKGGLGMPLVISILMFVMYHVFTIIGEKSVKSEVMDPWLGMWMASLIYLPLGVFFTWKATTDAPLLDAEAWHKAFSKIDFISPIIRKLKPKSKDA